jgi:hypothetical protein
MIKTTHITNLGNSIPKLLIESAIKAFIANHETYIGEKIKKEKINILSIFPQSNGESTYYRVTWSLK